MKQIPKRGSSSWAERVRVVEKRRLALGGRPGKLDGWRVEIRLSGDGEAERWTPAFQAAIFGPAALVSAIDETRRGFKSLDEAEAAAIKIATILDSLEAKAVGRGLGL